MGKKSSRHSDEPETLAEKIKFAQHRIISANHVLTAYEREITRVGDEIDELRRRQVFLRGALEDAPDLLRRAKADLEKFKALESAKAMKGTGSNRRPMSRSKIQKKRDRYLRIKAQIARLQAELDGDN